MITHHTGFTFTTPHGTQWFRTIRRAYIAQYIACTSGVGCTVTDHSTNLLVCLTPHPVVANAWNVWDIRDGRLIRTDRKAEKVAA